MLDINFVPFRIETAQRYIALIIAILIPVLGGSLSGYYGMIGENKSWYRSLDFFTFQPLIIYDNSALQAELLIYKGDSSVKRNSYLITFKDADPKGSAFEMLNGLKKPSWNPPSWIFGPVWTVLYIMMGIASYLVWEKGGSLWLYAAQLATNLAWSPVFFRAIGKKHRPDVALFVIIALWFLIAATIRSFYKVSTTAGLLLIPYFMWVTYAVSLNWYIVANNP